MLAGLDVMLMMLYYYQQNNNGLRKTAGSDGRTGEIAG